MKYKEAGCKETLRKGESRKGGRGSNDGNVELGRRGTQASGA